MLITWTAEAWYRRDVQLLRLGDQGSLLTGLAVHLAHAVYIHNNKLLFICLDERNSTIIAVAISTSYL